MKTVFTLLVILFSIGQVYSTGQHPDYLIQNQDTLPIFNNPLEQYFQKIGNRDLIDFKSPCRSTACWRGYIAYWELKNDSLFLLKITDCVKDCGEVKEPDLFATFGDSKPFASWYNGTLTIPNGNIFSGSDMGYNAIYEYEDKLLIENGILKSRWQISNIDLIQQIKLNNKLYNQILTLKDTLLVYLNKNIDWEKIDNTEFDCTGSFILTYNQKGKIKKVDYIKLQDESDDIWYKLYEWRFDKKCSRRIKSAIKSLSLAYLEPHRDFKIEIRLSYFEKHLKMWECRHYFKPIPDREIEDYIRKQLEVKE